MNEIGEFLDLGTDTETDKGFLLRLIGEVRSQLEETKKELRTTQFRVLDITAQLDKMKHALGEKKNG